MFGRAPVDLGVASVVLIDGADGREKREVLPAGDNSSAEDREEFESTENRGWG